MKDFLLRLKFWQRGFIFGIIMFMVLFANDLFWLVKGYTGKCGDLLVKSAKTYSCSLWDYLLNDPFYGLYTGINAKLTWSVYIGAVFVSVFLFAVLGFILKRTIK